MKVLIIEDEEPAAGRMVELLKFYDQAIEIEEILDSVKDAVLWLNSHLPPNLIFMDIQLADGLCFEIFDRADVQAPVVFTTAFQEYAIRAFKVNSIDYLLKPIDFHALKVAIEKFRRYYSDKSKPAILRHDILESVRQMLEKPSKNRFIIKVGEHLRPVSASEIHIFFSLEKATNLCTADARKYIIDYSLDHLMELIDNEKFFRINRKNIINRDAIADIIIYSKNRLKIKLRTPGVEPVIVSRDRVNTFRSWLDA